MSIRPIQLPQDFDLIERLAVDSFQYPDNPEWSIQREELGNIHEMVRQYKKIWPFIKLVGLFSYQVRNAMVGFIWSEAGDPAGVVFLSSQNPQEWWISTLGVLPEFRRRGIARKLLLECIAFFQTQQAERVYLWVIMGNTPARLLYENNGFIHFSSDLVLEHTGGEVESPNLPSGYYETEMNLYDWQTRYAIAKTITPSEIQKFSPIKKEDFKIRPLMRLIMPLMHKAEGIEIKNLLYRCTDTSEIAARIEIVLRKRAGGIVHSQIRYVPGHEVLADFLVQKLLFIAHGKNPDRRINVGLPTWQEAAVAAAKRWGFKTRMENCQMVLILNKNKEQS